MDEYGWLDDAVRRARDVLREHRVPWRLTLREPASDAACDAAEERLGFALPPSVRAFYRRHDGMALKRVHPTFDDVIVRVHGPGQLVGETLRRRDLDDENGEDPVPELLSLIDLNDSNGLVLDASRPTADGEYPLLDANHEEGPAAWRISDAAPGFGLWLRAFFDGICAMHDPLDGSPLRDVSGSLAASTGDTDDVAPREDVVPASPTESERARRRVLLGFAQASYFGYSSAFVRGLAIQYRALGFEHRGDVVLARIMGFAADARAREEAGGSAAETVTVRRDGSFYRPEFFRETYGRPVPEELLGIMRAYGSIELFRRAFYARDAEAPDPFAKLVLFGGLHDPAFAHSCLRPDYGSDAPDGAMIVGSIGADFVIADARGALWRRPIRLAHRPNETGDTTAIEASSRWVNTWPPTPEVYTESCPESTAAPGPEMTEHPPARIADSLEGFLAEAFAKSKAGLAPYDLGPVGRSA